jgi:hypothetical protein
MIEREVAPVGSTNKSRSFASEHKTKAYKEKQQRSKHEVNEVFHQDIRRVLRPRKTSLTQRESWLHPEYQHSSQQHPYGIE